MAQRKSRSAQLNGLPALSYIGVLPSAPTNFILEQHAPTASDWRNVYIGDVWLDNSPSYGNPPAAPTGANLWILVSLSGNSATWINFTSGAVASVGAGVLIYITGTAMNPIVNVEPSVAAGFLTDDTNTAVPALNILTVAGANGISTSSAGSTLTITGGGTLAQSFVTQAGTAVPVAGVLTVNGYNGITTSGAGSTIIIATTSDVAQEFVTDAGTAVPNTGVLTVSGAHGINTSGAGSTVTVAINNTITLGDLADVTGTPSLTLTTGDATLSAGNINLPVTNSAGTEGLITVTGVPVINFTGQSNTFVGGNSGNTTLTQVSAINNSGFGSDTLQSLTTGHDNIAIGRNCLLAATTAFTNSGAGNACLSSLTTGSFNQALGDAALKFLLTGVNNLALGYNAGINYVAAESSNVLINNGGVLGESNVIRIGAQGSGAGQQNQFFAAGIAGVTTTVADAVAVLVSSSTGQLGTVSSSERYKENIQSMGSYSDVLRKLRPVTFNYKSHSPESISVGLIAEEVDEVAPQLVVYNKDGECETVKYHDLVPMLLNEVIKLNKRIELLESK